MAELSGVKSVIRQTPTIDRIHLAEKELLANYAIAKAICPKGKGWAFIKKTGVPLNFANEWEHTSLVNWAQRQPWWQEDAPQGWFQNMVAPPKVVEVYTFLCIDLAEGKFTKSRMSYHFRNLVADVLQEIANGKRKPKSPGGDGTAGSDTPAAAGGTP